MKKTLTAMLCVAVLCASCLAQAKDNNPQNDVYQFPTKSYFKRFWGDLKELPTKPFHWHKKEWLIAGAFIGGSVAAFSLDSDIRQYYRTHRSGFLTSVSDVTTHFGDYKQQVPIIGGMWIVGTATDNLTLKKMAGDGMEASLIAAGMITPLLVLITGRDLPNANERAMNFQFFSKDRYSYPSGHTTEAFAMATVIDQNLREKFGYWQTPFLYAMAVGCAESRLYDHTHYLSDVILGAGIGWSVGYWISNKPRGGDKDRTVMILPSPSGGAMLAYKF